MTGTLHYTCNPMLANEKYVDLGLFRMETTFWMSIRSKDIYAYMSRGPMSCLGTQIFWWLYSIMVISFLLLLNGATSRTNTGPTIEFQLQHSEINFHPTYGKSPLMADQNVTFLAMH